MKRRKKFLGNNKSRTYLLEPRKMWVMFVKLPTLAGIELEISLLFNASSSNDIDNDFMYKDRQCIC